MTRACTGKASRGISNIAVICIVCRWAIPTPVPPYQSANCSISSAVDSLARLASRLRDVGVAGWHESQGGFGSLGPLQRHHHLGHLFPCPAQYAGRVGHRGGEPTETQLDDVS